MPRLFSRLSRNKKKLLAAAGLAAAGLAGAVHFGFLPAQNKALSFLLSKVPQLELLLPETSRFDRFTEDVFRQELLGNTLSLHYMVADPSACGFGDTEATLGNLSPNSRKKYYMALENYLSSLQKFSYDKLTEKQQLTYDIFKDYLDTELSAGSLFLYSEPLSPTLGIQAQLPVLLAEYPFRTRGDIEDYLSLLSQVPDYFQSLLSFENTKSANGLFMGDACAQEVIAQCQEFIADPGENYLLEIFDEKIDAISNLTADEKASYKNTSRQLLQSCVIPAYQSLIDGLGTMLGTGTNPMGLYYYPSGSDYYAWLVHSSVGDSRAIEDIEAAVKKQMVEDYSSIQKLLASYRDSGQTTKQEAEADSSTSGELAEAAWAVEALSPAAVTDPASILNELRQKITQDFPLLPDVRCEVKYVHDSLQNYLSPAFYLTPAIDDFTNNVIYINPASDYSDLELYTTLAHEGYPGHLYQSVYFSSTHPDLLRNLLAPDGYVEGWATYVEMYSYGLWEKDPQLALLGQRNRSFMLGLASLLDIGIHYRGYSPEQVSSFLGQLGFGEDTARSLYQSVLESPANYLQYYVGYLNFLDLRDYAKELLGNGYSLKKYHTMVLDAGPAPFSILKTYMESRGKEKS